jgi:hypothetical protein
MTATPLVMAVELSAATSGKILPTDPRLTGLLAGVSAGVRRYCGWHICPAVTETLTLDGPGGDLLVLPAMALTAVTAVTELGTSLAVYVHATETGDYEWSANGEIRRIGARWTEHFRAITASITHGYAETPADLAQVITQVCVNALASPMGATREQAIGFAASWSATGPGVSGGMSLLKRDLAILDLYRLPGRA